MTATYKSPTYKLVKFFESSRDQWKSKYKDKKAHVIVIEKRLKDQQAISEKLQNKIELLEHLVGAEKKIIK